MGGEEVKLLGRCTHPYTRRVEIALKIKGVEYEYIEQDLKNKSELLLKSNPIHKNIPVLIHNGSPIVDPQIILEYIDETWKSNPILPQDPYDRAIARFWCRFMDEKVTLPGRQTVLASPGEATIKAEKLDKEKLKSLKTLEKQMEGKKFFGGDKIGVIDITAIAIAAWSPALQEASGKEFVTAESFPEIWRWTEEIMKCEVIKENLPSKERLVAVFKADILQATTTSAVVSPQNNISPPLMENLVNGSSCELTGCRSASIDGDGGDFTVETLTAVNEVPGDNNNVKKVVFFGGDEKKIVS